MMFLHFAASAARTESHTYEWRGQETGASGRHPSAVKTVLSSISAALLRLCHPAGDNRSFLSSRRDLVVGLAPPPPQAPPPRAEARKRPKDDSFLSPSAFTHSHLAHN